MRYELDHNWQSMKIYVDGEELGLSFDTTAQKQFILAAWALGQEIERLQPKLTATGQAFMTAFNATSLRELGTLKAVINDTESPVERAKVGNLTQVVKRGRIEFRFE
jgi:hypothetical protein